MAAGIFPLASDCGARTLATLIDSIAQNDPQRVIVSVPRSNDLSQGFTDISFASFGRAVSRCCWWLDESSVGRDEASKIFFYMGPLDIRYLIILIAASKTGRVAFFSSHRNSLDAHLSLLNSTKCQTVLVPDKAPAILKQILDARPMEQFAFPSLESFLDDSKPVKDYVYRADDFQAVKDETFVVLHTSGSTGIPKPVYVTHGTFASNDAYQLIPSLGGKPTFMDYNRGNRFLLCLPLFHAACLGMWAMGVYAGFTSVVPPVAPLTADVANGIITYGQIQGALMPPSLIIDLYNNPKHLENLIHRLNFLSYVGGTLASDIGDHLSKNIKLITLFGTTENMYYPLEIHDRPLDWAYISMSPYLGTKYRNFKDELGELIVVRDPSKIAMQGVFSTFPNINEYATSDLYEQHPTRPNLWKFTGRSDDIICFNNAEKLNPITMESVILTHPEVEAVLIGGNGEFQASLLIEPRNHPATPAEAQALIDSIWPTVHKANQGCPAHGRIVKEFIMLSDPERALPRAGKTTVQRAGALKLYEEDFKEIYRRNKKTGAVDDASSPLPGKDLGKSNVAEDCAVKTGNSALGSQFLPLKMDTSGDAHIQVALQRMIQDLLPEMFGSMVTQMTRSMLQLGSTSESAGTARATSSQPFHSDKPLKSVGSTHTEIQSGSNTEVESNSDPIEAVNVKGEIYRALAQSTYLAADIADDADFFEHGLDSIQVTGFIAEMNKSLAARKGGATKELKLESVYSYPSVRELAAYLEI